MPEDKWAIQKYASNNIQRMLRGEITKEQAAQNIAAPRQCKPIERGLCQEHGQLLADCEEMGLS